MSDLYGLIMSQQLLILIINFILALVIVFIERKNPSATLAWILVLFFLPVAGALIYLFFAQNISRRKIYRLTHAEIVYLSSAINEQIEKLNQGTLVFKNRVAKLWRHMVKLNLVYGNAFLTENNRIEIITDGREMFHKLVREIKRAKYSVDVQFFIVKDDLVGRKLIDVMVDKAREGVKVRFLVDALGSRRMNDRKLKPLIDAGGEVAYFFKPKFKYFTLNLNYRNHRKIVVIDDHVGYIGGFNIAKEYLGFKKKFGYWRDTHIRIWGSAVKDLKAIFIMDWRVASRKHVEIEEDYFYPVEDAGTCGVQIVMCGPESPKEEIKRAMMRMITFAGESIYLQTPYFVPDRAMLESLKMAAQSGVKVKIMIPCKPDHPFVYWANYAYCGELIKSGARVFIYQNGFLHAKTLTVDTQVSTVGSANFDNRSFKLNFEANAFVYDEDFARRMEEKFKEDLKLSTELTIDKYEARSSWVKIREAVAVLLSDIL